MRVSAVRISFAGMTDKLAVVALASGIAGATALAIAAVPLFWHPQYPQANDADVADRKPPHLRADRLAFVGFRDQWPDRAIEPPVEPIPNLLPFEPPIFIPPIEEARAVKTLRYTAVTSVPKTPIAPTVEPKVERGIVLPKPDFCSPGRRVDHGRRWRCVYARRR